MGQHELNQPHEGDKRYKRRKEDGSFAEGGDQLKSLRQDVKQHAETRSRGTSGTDLHG